MKKLHSFHYLTVRFVIKKLEKLLYFYLTKNKIYYVKTLT